MAIRFFFGSGPGFVNRTQSDPGFVNPVRSGPGFVNPIRSDPILVLLTPDKYRRALHFSFINYLVIMPAKERQQISFLGYSHFI